MEAPPSIVDGHHRATHRRTRIGLWYPGRMYVSGRVDIFDMVDIDLFTVVTLNMMVLKLGCTGKFEPMFYNYLKPLTSLDEGLYALACEEVVRCLGLADLSLSWCGEFRVKSLMSHLELRIELELNELVLAGKNHCGRDYVSSGEDAEQVSEDAGTNDDDDVDKDFLVDEENEIIEPDVDVHLFGISMYLPFDNIGITNLVSDDVLEGGGRGCHQCGWF
ncbi:hypothetical protein Tco_0711515 [Tanacetum coccineum]